MPWELGPGVVELPVGTRIRGRSLHGPAPALRPDWGLYLRGWRPDGTPWPSRWLRWPDFWLPLRAEDAARAFEEAHRRAAGGERVEVASRGGRGRTGTALACIAQLSGMRAEDATAWVRRSYDSHAVETPWQRRYVLRFADSRPG